MSSKLYHCALLQLRSLLRQVACVYNPLWHDLYCQSPKSRPRSCHLLLGPFLLTPAQKGDIQPICISKAESRHTRQIQAHLRPEPIPHPLSKDLPSIVRQVVLDRLGQLEAVEGVGEAGVVRRAGANNGDISIDRAIADELGKLVLGRGIRLSALVAVDMVIPSVGARVVVEFARFPRRLPSQCRFQLPLLVPLVAVVP